MGWRRPTSSDVVDNNDNNGHILALLSLALMTQFMLVVFSFLYLFQMHTLELFLKIQLYI